MIVPIAVEQYGKQFVINIGENFDVNTYGQNKAEAIKCLRDILATLKWEIWESRIVEKRKNLNENEWKEYIEARFKEWSYFNMEYINGLIFRPKEVIEPTEAFAYRERLIPCMRNAFLFRK